MAGARPERTTNPNDVPSWLEGGLDEIRFSTAVRSQSWLATSHANQRDPTRWIKVAAQEEF